LGIPGILSAYRAGNVGIANAIGTGIADDKSIYPYVPSDDSTVLSCMKNQYFSENAPTYQCRKPEDLQYTLAHLEELVVKETHGAGGYGMLIGPVATSKAELEKFRQYYNSPPRSNTLLSLRLSLINLPNICWHLGYRPTPYRFTTPRSIWLNTIENGTRWLNASSTKRRLACSG
jgi:hypothetical protein